MRFKKSLMALVVAAALFLPQSGFAQAPWPTSVGQPGVGTPDLQSNPFTRDLIGEGGVSEGLPAEYQLQQTRDPIALVNRLISIALSFMGIILVVLMVRAGYRWMASAGNEDMVTEAKTSIRNAAIGLLIIFFAYSFVWFLGRRIQTSTRSYGRGGLFQTGGEAFTPKLSPPPSP